MYKAEISFTILGDISIFINKPDEAKKLVQRTLADATGPEVSEDMINILSISFTNPTRRRLEDGFLGLERNWRLGVEIEFEIAIPADSDATIDENTIDSTTFKASLAQKVADVSGGHIVVSGLDVIIETEAVVEEQEMSVSVAFPMAKLPSFLMLFIIVLSGKQVLA